MEIRSPGRGRPRGFDRNVALDAAMRLFWRKGYTATSIADLCAAMGIGSPSLYAAFGSKEALFEEALRHYVATQAPLIWEGFAAAASAREAVEALLLASARVLPGASRSDVARPADTSPANSPPAGDQPAPVRPIGGQAGAARPGGCMVTLSGAAGEGCGAPGRLVTEARAESLALITTRLERAQREGEIGATVDTAAVARCILAVQQGMSVQARDGAGPDVLEAVARAAMRGWPALVGQS